MTRTRHMTPVPFVCLTWLLILMRMIIRVLTLTRMIIRVLHLSGICPGDKCSAFMLLPTHWVSTYVAAMHSNQLCIATYYTVWTFMPSPLTECLPTRNAKLIAMHCNIQHIVNLYAPRHSLSVYVAMQSWLLCTHSSQCIAINFVSQRTTFCCNCTDSTVMHWIAMQCNARSIILYSNQLFTAPETVS